MEGISLGNIINGLLFLVLGFLLNRVFNEIDKLREADTKLSEQVAFLRPLLISKEDFDRHVTKEEKNTEKIWERMEEIIDGIQQLRELLASQGKFNNG